MQHTCQSVRIDNMINVMFNNIIQTVHSKLLLLLYSAIQYVIPVDDAGVSPPYGEREYNIYIDIDCGKTLFYKYVLYTHK